MSPADKLLKRPARRPGAEEKASCPCLLSYYASQVILKTALYVKNTGRNVYNIAEKGLFWINP